MGGTSFGPGGGTYYTQFRSVSYYVSGSAVSPYAYSFCYNI